MENENIYDFSKPYFVAGEYILWKGKPEKGRIFTANDIYLIPFSIFWCGFAIFWTVTAASSGAPFPFWMVGLLFIGVGMYLVFGRFIMTAYLRTHTAYVITNKKILRLRGQKIDILDSKNLPSMRVTIHKSGNGTIIFGQDSIYNRGWNTSAQNGYGQAAFSLDNIANPIQVQELIKNMENT